MRANDFLKFLKENTPAISSVGQYDELKKAVASKIKELPPDKETVKALREIEDLLRYVNAGGRWGMVQGKLQQIDDKSVNEAQKLLAKYILSMDVEVDDREEMFDLWKADKLIDADKLLKTGRKTFDQIVNKYYENPAINELANDVMRINALGQGKGEFGLSVLSKQINKQEGKGDLSIKGVSIEVKTTDGGAGRFTDQEVRPAEGFENAARALAKYVSTHPTLGRKVPKSGLNLVDAISFGQSIPQSDKSHYFKLVNAVISRIFNKIPRVKKVMDAFQSGNVNETLKEYAKCSFDYYMGMKDDEAVLYINLTKDPIELITFKDGDELESLGMRFNAKTVYLTSVADMRLPYPQIDIVDTTFGKDAATKSMPKFNKTEMSAEDIMWDKIYSWATSFANIRGVSDAKTIEDMTSDVIEMIKQKIPKADIMQALEEKFPQLVANLPTAKAAAAPVTPQPAVPPQQAPAAPQPVNNPNATI